jgi:MFS transporter, AAHS family, 4-hydroxybenzoate transporter
LGTFAAGICIVGAQPALNALASTLYPTEIRAAGVGWSLGVSIPALFSFGLVIGLAIVTRRKLNSLS